MSDFPSSKRDSAAPLIEEGNSQNEKRFSSLSPQPQPIIINSANSSEVALPRRETSIVVNQVAPGISMIADTYLPFETECPFCKKEITTTAIQTFNCGTCCLCYFTGLFLFCCIQLCRGKDICCYDAVHKCPECGKTVAVYNSC